MLDQQLEKIRKAKRNLKLDDNIDNTRRRIVLQGEIFKHIDFTDAIKQDFEEFLDKQGDIFEILQEKATNANQRQQRRRESKEGQIKRNLTQLIQDPENKLNKHNTRILNDLERSIIAFDPNILEASDLRFETMAKYKSLKKKDVLTHDQITQRVLRRRSIRRLVLEDEIEDLSDLEDNIEEEGRSQSVDDITEDETQNSGNSSFDSQASKVAFWKDINTKDSDYKQAVIIKKIRNAIQYDKVNAQKKQSPNNVGVGRRRSIRDMNVDRDKIQRIKNHLRINDQNYTTSQENYTHDRITKMQKAHLVEIKNIKNLSVQYAIDYFKQKSSDLNKIFTEEIFEVLDQYDLLRRKLSQKKQKLERASEVIMHQEKIINELCTFYHVSLAQVFDKTFGHKDEIIAAYKKKNQGMAMSAVVQNNPFQLYCSYKTIYKPLMDEKADLPYKRRYEDILEQNKQLLSELDSINNISEIYIRQGEDFKSNLDTLEKEKQALQESYELKMSLLQEEIKSLKLQNGQIAEVFQRKEHQIKEMIKIEVQVYESIIDQLMKSKNQIQEELKKTRTILRIPRLYEKYLESIKQLQMQENLKIMEIKRLNKMNESQQSTQIGTVHESLYKLGENRPQTQSIGSKIMQNFSRQNKSQQRTRNTLLRQNINNTTMTILNDSFDLTSHSQHDQSSTLLNSIDGLPLNQQQFLSVYLKNLKQKTQQRNLNNTQTQDFLNACTNLESLQFLNRSVDYTDSRSQEITGLSKSLQKSLKIHIPKTSYMSQRRNRQVNNFSINGLQTQNIKNLHSFQPSTRIPTTTNAFNSRNMKQLKMINFNSIISDNRNQESFDSKLFKKSSDSWFLQNMSKTSRDRYLWTHGVKQV
eukprot:403341380